MNKPVQLDLVTNATLAMPAMEEPRPAPQNANDDGWNPDNPDLLVPCQPATQVYVNPYNQVCICQQDRYAEDDPYVIFSFETVPTLIARLQELLENGK